MICNNKIKYILHLTHSKQLYSIVSGFTQKIPLQYYFHKLQYDLHRNSTENITLYFILQTQPQPQHDICQIVVTRRQITLRSMRTAFLRAINTDGKRILPSASTSIFVFANF